MMKSAAKIDAQCEGNAKTSKQMIHTCTGTGFHKS
jgi:hypothetical protein